jgi:cytochrome c5
MLTALTIWFAHFMVCWAASELVWPNQWPANAVAAAATVIALAALGLHSRSVQTPPAGADMSHWAYRFAKGAIALATVAVLFNALPAVVLLPTGR